MSSSAIARADVVVVGGGISGYACAASAARRGATVIVIEKESQPAREGSGRAQGSLRLQGRHAAEFPIAQESIELWRQLGDEADCELRFDGNIYLCDDPAELPTLRALVDEAHRAGLTDVRLIDRDQAQEVLPLATGPFEAAMWSPYCGQCDPTKSTRAFAARAQTAGVTTLADTLALEIVEADGSVRGLLTTRGLIGAAAVVVAGGVWTPNLLATVGVDVPLMPVAHGQAESVPTDVRAGPTVRAFGFGFRQRPDGRLVLSAGINSRVEHRLSFNSSRHARLWASRYRVNRGNVRLRFDPTLTLRQLRDRDRLSPRQIPIATEPPAPHRADLDTALAAVKRTMPEFEELRISRYWTGLLDISPDGLPIIDHEAGPTGLVFVTGLNGHGLALGPVIGEITADLALNNATQRPIRPFRLARFRERRIELPTKML
ncbi:MAG TPA: FAD-binding oxidoreductase [Gaiellales bacterium]|nr:FAD-binding oxidoreductase [Gaiellales bacterium]